MDFKKVAIPEGARLYQAHQLTYIYKGVTYLLEIDEHADGSFTGHGEHSTDKSSVLASVNGRTAEECLSALINKIRK